MALFVCVSAVLFCSLVVHFWTEESQRKLNFWHFIFFAAVDVAVGMRSAGLNVYQLFLMVTLLVVLSGFVSYSVVCLYELFFRSRKTTGSL